MTNAQANGRAKMDDRAKLRKKVYAELRETYHANQRCVLCACGVPGGTSIIDDFHEIIPKSRLPGQSNAKTLFNKTNIAPTCRYHHDVFQHYPIIWRAAMCKVNLAQKSDYGLPDDPSPLVAECLGRFGYGDTVMLAIPKSLKLVYAGSTSDEIYSWCVHCCPFAQMCITKTRKRIGNE